MQFLPVPKLMQWQPSLDQHYITNRSTLVTSGCSFTASTLQLQTAASWPGYVMDRCRFSKVWDYSVPGVGNQYIHDSVINHFDNLDQSQTDQCMVIVMWSGIDRKEKKLSNLIEQYQNRPTLNTFVYVRESRDVVEKIDRKSLAQESADLVFDLHKYLTSKKIPFVFSSYANLLFPPFIPKTNYKLPTMEIVHGDKNTTRPLQSEPELVRDNTFEFNKFVSEETLLQLQNLGWIPNQPMDFLYEYAFTNNFLNHGNGFHPPAECNLKWTDEILLPGMTKQGLIQSI